MMTGQNTFGMLLEARTASPVLPRLKTVMRLDARSVATQLDQAITLLKRLLKGSHGHLRGRTVVASLPEAKTFMKVIRVGISMDDAALKQRVLEEIQQNIPLPIEQIYVVTGLIHECPAIEFPGPAPFGARHDREK